MGDKNLKKIELLVDIAKENLTGVFGEHRDTIIVLAKGLSDELLWLMETVLDIERSCWDVGVEDIEYVARDIIDSANKMTSLKNSINGLGVDLNKAILSLEEETKKFEEIASGREEEIPGNWER